MTTFFITGKGTNTSRQNSVIDLDLRHYVANSGNDKTWYMQKN